MKKTATLLLLIVLTAAVCGTACRGRRSGASNGAAVTTQTIAPAAPAPAPNGTDAATQTVDLEDGRSEEDGGVLTNPQSGKAAPATQTTAAPAAKAPAKKHR